HPSEAPSEAIEPSIPREKAPEATEGPIGGRSPLEAQHQQAIAPIVEKGSIKKLLTFSKVPIPEKKLYARHARAFAIAASKAAEAFCKKPTEKALLSFLLLPRVLGLGLQKGGLAALLRNYPANIPTLEDLETFLGQQKPPTLQKNPPKVANPAQRAVKLLERGFLGRASRTLIDPVPIAPNTEANRAILLEKHPIGPEKPFQRKTYPRPGQPVTEATVVKAITSIGKEKAPGLSGWTRPLLDLVIRGDSPEWPLKDLQLEGLPVLGTYIGPIAGRRSFLAGKLATLEGALTALKDLPKQHSLLLLRGSIQLLLRHLQRQLCPIGLDDLWGEADSLIKEAILAIVARSPSEVPKEPNPALIALPTREGGLGIPLHEELALQLYQAAMRASQPTIAKIRAAATGDPPLQLL
ncbi:hypothetical protein FCULG_00012932, partial [Fusarium culmorum]